ncbi:phage tail tip fiber protein [Pseudomonas sp. R76]|uniref:phage tail tip fiber protein n=1 Tax=Pseudomonas sp. R76 TaxID=1573711 RepID=UPI00131F9CD5|nr:hypothetical protein [Pseudomonas sp. R76]QHD05521.1 hypothetical protein PspR76_07165 [Pseudomonas sp. R76]
MSGSIQSSNYVPGVSGWKIDTDTGSFELASDRVTVSGVDPKAVYCGKSRKESHKPFIVVDGVIYISQASIEDASIAKAKIGNEWSVRICVTPDGEKYAAGLGLGVHPECLVQPDRFDINGLDASKILEMLAGKISKTELCRQVLANSDQLGSSFAEQVKDLLRKELMPGGLLHRSR